MTTPRQRRVRRVALYVLIAVVGYLSFATNSNQRKINEANTQLKQQAEAGQRALTRQCSLLVVSRKLYADMLNRHVITAEDFALVFSTAQRACGQR